MKKSSFGRIIAGGLALGLGLALSAPASADDKKATRAWKAKCAACHGNDGKGDTEKGKKMGISDLTKAAWQKEFTDEKIREAVTKGLKREKDGKKQEMDAYGEKLAAADIDGIIKIIRSLKK